ncbi:hypothetical protein BDK51DRAFT_35389 [Blyttiomyces helicus]|uniref:Glyoxal oxidase N-terminal domain-containing protein n=1 Tax=Blyttiomyces helicus TaxID=388810 RepID=A0A4P9WF54_9FUNG|nr:hypothetical protein BDK51DRAFT_35389 [Blyttiomyces helicus]|eukprot:RKO90455.1 hypothetical protein BDK51DRAFT_35389 [Blyttiomyces helicus]
MHSRLAALAWSALAVNAQNTLGQWDIAGQSGGERTEGPGGPGHGARGEEGPEAKTRRSKRVTPKPIFGTGKKIGDLITCIHTMLLPQSRLMCIERPHKGPGDGGPFNSTSNSDSIVAPTGGFFPGNGVSNRTVALIELQGEGPVVLSASIFEDGAPNVYANSFCGGHVQMGNGSILVVGGDQQQWTDESGNHFLVSGGKKKRVYTPCGPTDYGCTNGTWTSYPDMTTSRWYPTVVTLKDGNQIILGGSIENINMQTPDPVHNNNPTYEYLNNPTVGTWPKTLPILTWAFPHSLYPVATVMPSGRVYVFVSNESIVIDPSQDFSNPAAVESHPIPDLVPGGPGTSDPKVAAAIADHSPWIYPHSATFTVLPMTLKNNYSFKLQVCGGSKSPASAVSRGAQYNVSIYGDGGQARPYASASCVQINPDDAQPVWSAPDPMPNARLMPDSVLLPDGKILYVNGAGWGQAGGDAGESQYATDPVYGVDLFDPEAPSGSQWTSMANATVPRLYHSGALLLSSGHVITTGSEMQNYIDFWAPGGPKENCYPVQIGGVNSPSCIDRAYLFTIVFWFIPLVQLVPGIIAFDSTGCWVRPMYLDARQKEG